MFGKKQKETMQLEIDGLRDYALSQEKRMEQLEDLLEIHLQNVRRYLYEAHMAEDGSINLTEIQWNELQNTIDKIGEVWKE